MTDDTYEVPDSVPETTNHDFYHPEPGFANWHTPLNANWAALDHRVEIRDAEDQRDTYTAKDGAKFFATDTGAIFLGDGDSWERIAAGGGASLTEVATGTFTHTGGGSTTVTVEAVSSDELGTIDVVVGPTESPSWDGDYGYNFDWARSWDDEHGQVDVVLTANWQTDPGRGNDLELRYGVQVR